AQGNQQAVAVSRELVLDDSAQRSRALPLAASFFFRGQFFFAAQQRARVDQQLCLARASVEGPKIQLVLVVLLRLQVGDIASVRREFRLAQARGGEVGRAENALDGQ